MSEGASGTSSHGGGSGPSGPRAGFFRRFAAALVDGILLGIPYFVIANALDDPVTAQGIYTLISAVYFTVLEGGASGQTLGKKLLGIRVIGFRDGAPIGYGRGFIRWIGRLVSTLPILLGYLWMIWDKEKQTWHDKFATAVVVPESAYPVQGAAS